MILHVAGAKYLGDFRVRVSFNNGQEGIADLREALRGPMFEPLKDESLFAQLSVDAELDTLTWPNGADLAPEYIYYQAFKNEPKMRKQFKEWGYVTE
jgi:hypothetical protein